MNLIIVGAGKVGSALVQNLIKENHDIVVVDLDAVTVGDVVNRYDVKGVIGGGVERSVLLDAGVEKADFLIACTSRDEMNILCCVLGKKLGAKRTIARVRDPEYFKEMENMCEYLGLDYYFNPEYRTAVEISKVLKFPSALNVENFADGKVNMVEFRVERGNPIVSKSLKEISKEYGNKFLIGMVYRDGEVFIPRGDFVVNEGDNIHIIASESVIADFSKRLKIFKPKAKSVFIVGGGKIAYYLAQDLIESGVNVKIVENDKARAEELSVLLPKATIIQGDGTDQEILDEESLRLNDACVTLTGVDEENVIVSLFAKGQGVSKVITKVDKLSVFDMVKTMGLDTVVSPRIAIAHHIIRFVRAHQADSGSGVNTLYKFHDKVEALEFDVGESFSGKDIPLKDLHVKRNILIGGIVRDGNFIIPDGQSKLMSRDKVVVVATASQITELEQILR